MAGLDVVDNTLGITETMSHRTIIAALLSLLALGAAVVHALFPEIVVDGVTVALLAIAVAPWLGVFFKSLELPGGVKIEYHELKKAEEQAREAGLIKATAPEIKLEEGAVYERIAAGDPNLALVGLRIELEKALVVLGANHGVSGDRKTIRWIANELTKDGVLPEGTASLLSDLIPTLNSAAHGAKVDERSVQWALTAGTEILHALRSR